VKLTLANRCRELLELERHAMPSPWHSLTPDDANGLARLHSRSGLAGRLVCDNLFLADRDFMAAARNLIVELAHAYLALSAAAGGETP
jgi:hypothetical protein